MTAPSVSATVLGVATQAYYPSSFGGNVGPGPYSTSTLTLRSPTGAALTATTDAGVVLVVGVWATIGASGIVPTVTSIAGGGLTWHRYVDPHQDILAPTQDAGLTGQTSTELWWTYSADPLAADASFTLTYDPPLSYSTTAQRGALYCRGLVFSGCATPSSPWDPKLDLPASWLVEPVSVPGPSDAISYTLTNGETVAYCNDLYTNIHITYLGSALVGTGGDETAIVLECDGYFNTLGASPQSTPGWNSVTGVASGLYGSSDLVYGLSYRAVAPPPTPPPAYTAQEVLFPQTEAGNSALDCTAAGFGAFSKAILSLWFCRGPSDGSLVFQSVSADHAASYAANITIGYVGTAPWTVDVSLYHTNTGDPIYQGSFTSPATSLHALANILLSFDTASHAIAVYVNETAATATVSTWSSTATVNAGGIGHWNLEVIGGIADFFFAPGVYTDLTVLGHRRLFHDASLNVLDLELSSFNPYAYFTVRASEPGGGIASDFAYNDSPKPSWDIINGPLVLGDCTAGDEESGSVAILLPGQIIFQGLFPDGPGSTIGGTENDRSVSVGVGSLLFTGLTPSGLLNTVIGGAGQILFTGRKPGAIFVRYRDPRTPSFFAVELDVYSPGGGSETLRVSDIGYRSRASDTIGLQVYPSVLDIAFDIDRHLGLEPGASSSAGFGSVTLHNVGQRFDNYTLSRNSDSRNVRILVGNKSTDSDRGVLVDPPYAELRPFFGGAALPWTLSEGSLEIPLRDATYWADRPLQTKLYDGNGGYGGGPDLKGKPLPVTRGGLLPNNPVENVPLVAVDTVNLIYQWTDGPGHLVNLYEGGALVFSSEGTTTDLYTGAPSPGAYRVDETRGLVQLGSRPIRTLTADVTGAFAVAGHKPTAVDIARYVLTELMEQPESELELASWYNAESRYPYTAGFFVGPEQQQGLDTVRYLLGSIGARLFTFRNGKLGVSILRALAPDVVPSFTISRDTAMAVEPVPLPASLDPPPWRWRVGSYRMHQVQTSDFDEAINPVRKTHIGQEYPFLSLSEAPELKDVWRRPNDPDPVRTALINVYAAQDLSDDMLALWRGRPGLYQVTMPYEQSAEMEIGDVVTLDWPLADLDGGKAGQIVGEQVRSYDGTGKLYVLVA